MAHFSANFRLIALLLPENDRFYKRAKGGRAIDERDHASNIFLQWFVSEQVEEEANVSAVLDKLNLVNDDPGGMFASNQEMGTRVFTAPV